MTDFREDPRLAGEDTAVATLKHHDFQWFREHEWAEGDLGKCANHFMILYHLIRARDRPTVVEFGSATGHSTCTALTACEEAGGRLVSIDIEDFADSASSDHWQFIRSDDREVAFILEQAPGLREGIDVLFIDSVHTRQHVQKLLELWFPLVKKGGCMVFHDTDPMTYRPGGRTPNRERHRSYLDMSNYLQEFFHGNIDQLFFSCHFGISGIGVMTKLAPLGSVPQPSVSFRGGRILRE